jgi:hypothetical protein
MQINKEKRQALVEFVTLDDATKALSFYGRLLLGTVLKIRRPKDYVEMPVRYFINSYYVCYLIIWTSWSTLIELCLSCFCGTLYSCIIVYISDFCKVKELMKEKSFTRPNYSELPLLL